jgi:hypothetical protein
MDLEIANSGEKLGGSGFVVGVPPQIPQQVIYLRSPMPMLSKKALLRCGSIIKKVNLVVQTKASDWEYHR